MGMPNCLTLKSPSRLTYVPWFETLPALKPCRATAHITEKAYISAGHTASVLHTMAVLQVFQTRLLKSLDEERLDLE